MAGRRVDAFASARLGYGVNVDEVAARQDCVDCVTPGYVLDLATRQVEIRCKLFVIFVIV